MLRLSIFRHAASATAITPTPAQQRPPAQASCATLSSDIPTRIHPSAAAYLRENAVSKQGARTLVERPVGRKRTKYGSQRDPSRFSTCCHCYRSWRALYPVRKGVEAGQTQPAQPRSASGRCPLLNPRSRIQSMMILICRPKRQRPWKICRSPRNDARAID